MLEFYPVHHAPIGAVRCRPNLLRASDIFAAIASCALVVLVAGCASAPAMTVPPASAKPIPANAEPPPPNVNLGGFPLPYRQGYADGCASATGSERKDATRFAGDGNYRTGWQDGLALCRKK